jgi:hypothetical protein
MTEAEMRRVLEQVFNPIYEEQIKQTALLERIAIAVEAKPAKKARTAVEPTKAGSYAWALYSSAYSARYGVLPVRNAKTNALCVQLVQRLGDDAGPVAQFYVGRHNDRLYINARHALELLVRDAEKIRTDWKRGSAPTSKDASNEESLSFARNQMEKIDRGEL